MPNGKKHNDCTFCVYGFAPPTCATHTGRRIFTASPAPAEPPHYTHLFSFKNNSLAMIFVDAAHPW